MYTYGQGISKPTQRGGGRGRSEGEVEGGVDERGREGGVDALLLLMFCCNKLSGLQSVE